MAGRTAKLSSKLLLAAFSLLIGLAFGEVALRLVWSNPYAGEGADRVLRVRAPHPNMDRVIDRSLIFPDSPESRLRTDARGYTMPSFVHADPDLTIAFLGGSTTANTVVREEDRFHVVAARELERTGITVNALNASRPGGTLHDSLNVLFNLVAFDEPDIVVLMHATNDIGLLFGTKGYRVREPQPVSGSRQLRWLAQMLSSRSYLAALARQVETGVVTAEPAARMIEKNDPARPKAAVEPFRARLRAFVHLCRDFGFEPVLMTQPLSSSRSALTPEWADLGNQDIFNAVTREVGIEEDVLVIDLVTYLQEEVPGWNVDDRLFWDGMHLNDEGSRLVGARIADELRPLAGRIVESR